MAGRFLLRRSQVAREHAQRSVAASVESIATLVALVTSLADRMEAMPSRGLDRDRERLGRVEVLRRAAYVGTVRLADVERGSHAQEQQDASG